MKRATMMMIFWTRSSALETTPSKKKEKTFKRGRRRHIKSTRSASPQNPHLHHHLKSSSFSSRRRRHRAFAFAFASSGVYILILIARGFDECR